MDKKHYLSALLLSSLAIFSTACSKSSDAESDSSEAKTEKTTAVNANDVDAVVNKFLNGKVGEKEYGEAIDIFTKLNESYMDSVEKYIENSNSEAEFNNKLQLFQIKNGDAIEMLSVILFNATPEDMGENNAKRMQDLQVKMNDRSIQVQQKAMKKFPASAPAPGQTGAPQSAQPDVTVADSVATPAK